MTILLYKDGRLLIDEHEPLENVSLDGLVGYVTDPQPGDTLTYNGKMWTGGAPADPAALGGIRFQYIQLTANKAATVNVSNSARCMLFLSSGYSNCCGIVSLAHYGAGKCDGPLWQTSQPAGISIDVSTDGKFSITAAQNSVCALMAISGTYTVA